MLLCCVFEYEEIIKHRNIWIEVIQIHNTRIYETVWISVKNLCRFISSFSPFFHTQKKINGQLRILTKWSACQAWKKCYIHEWEKSTLQKYWIPKKKTEFLMLSTFTKKVVKLKRITLTLCFCKREFKNSLTCVKRSILNNIRFMHKKMKYKYLLKR
jgi:hypothetical protein